MKIKLNIVIIIIISLIMIGCSSYESKDINSKDINSKDMNSIGKKEDEITEKKSENIEFEGEKEMVFKQYVPLVEDNRMHLLSVFRENEKIYMDLIIKHYVENKTISPEVFIKGLSIDDIKIKNYSQSYKYSFYNYNIDETVLLKFYKDKNRVPKDFINKECVIQRIEINDEFNFDSINNVQFEILYKKNTEDTIKFSLKEIPAESFNECKIAVKDELLKSIEKDYKYIRFTPEQVGYCPKQYYHRDTVVGYEEVDIPLGKSRIGGPVVDLPEDIKYPEGLFFAAQINLSEFKDYYFNEYLPKEGFLYVFVGGYGDTGKVIYSDCEVSELKRVVKEHGEWFYSGNLIKDIYTEEENINERYDEEWAQDGEELGWDPFAGFEKSKLFGIYTDCQAGEEELKVQLMSEMILLMQIGEDFNGEGILSVRIYEDDLKNLDFSKCIIQWSQS
ncbi:DUF1963 domain-containing protein [Oceanirhabdus sp. W0125-5]|uniref:DUF1963 domain-containing protein n=1 Tax=Oceanirhabdus sp. W0125-5 TaxID=2999116 RepID=UPI0022F2B40F|nr:DUF1963 domain-containing protein [Oceanirhabdus sp. W0125-5]WBW96548.1 DUF1963 domain-containing protein [Oceanirhabdus sp. W0125-5]